MAKAVARIRTETDTVLLRLRERGVKIYSPEDVRGFLPRSLKVGSK